jgi:hypothetical protein
MTSTALNQVKPMTPSAFARRLGVGVHKVLNWIDRGELGAINVASNPRRAKRWVILPEHIAAFETARSSSPRPVISHTQRRKKPKGFVEYH